MGTDAAQACFVQRQTNFFGALLGQRCCLHLNKSCCGDGGKRHVQVLGHLLTNGIELNGQWKSHRICPSLPCDNRKGCHGKCSAHKLTPRLSHHTISDRKSTCLNSS